MQKKYKFKLILNFIIVFWLILNTTISAETNNEIVEDNNTNTIVFNNNNTVYIDDVFNTGKDNGYSKKLAIENGDPHYGWKLGKFAITDFSSKRKDKNGNWVLLKNVNDKVSLYFILSQDINKLDNNPNIEIVEDENGYDNEFNIKKSNFGKGMLIVRKIDSSGNKNEPILYKDYLKGINVGANTKINVFEEGDYEIALDYEIKSNGLLFFDGYSNYRIRFNFSVRNGNCMVYPFDIETKSELTNTSITENGFYLDLANSQYLNINIKKEILKDGADGLIEDTRFNRPAKSGEEYTEEGIYTITARNEYTNEATIKKIYVGKNKLLKALVQNGEYSISDIKKMVALGAEIDENGNIENIPENYKKVTENFIGKNLDKNNMQFLVIFIPILLVILFIAYQFGKNKKMNEIIKNKIIQKENELKASTDDDLKNELKDLTDADLKNELKDLTDADLENKLKDSTNDDLKNKRKESENLENDEKNTD